MNANKVITAVVIVAIAVGAYFLFRKPSTKTDETQINPDNKQSQQLTVPEKAVATIDTSMGPIQVTLDGKAAPKTVGNFIKLAEEGFYDSTKFHRVISWFVIQGGDPNSKNSDPADDGFGGTGYTIPAELGLKANVGAIGMASSGPKAPSNGSQFFIVTEESEKNHALLDNQYTFFGYVTSGMDIVKKIAAVKTDSADKPLAPVTINKITIK